MNQAVKAYFFIPSGFKNFIERGFDGWQFIFFIYVAFDGIMAYEQSTSIKGGVYLFIQPFFLLILLSVLAVASAFSMGAKEPIIKGLRLVGLCLPPIGLVFYFLTVQSLMAYFAIYPIALFIFGSAFLGPRGKLLNGIVGLGVISLALALFYLHVNTTGKWFGRELVIDGYKAVLNDIPDLSKNESQVYRFLLLSTPELGHIPQVDEISDSLKIKRAAVRYALMKLDEKGRVILGADSDIRYAFPWVAFDQGYAITLKKTHDGITTPPVYAASAMHALSIPTLFKGSEIRIISYIKDVNEPLVIEISNGHISGCSRPDVLVYKSDSFAETEFYSSISGAKAKYQGRFDSTRLLDLDRAIIVAGEILNKNASGIL
jgi:hypothetical protein